MTVRLRPHHLLCMLTFIGKGYSPAFVENYKRIAARLSAGEEIVIVDGPDDVCAPLLGEGNPHCHRDSVTARDAKAAEAVAELIGQPVHQGAVIRLDAALMRRLRQAFAANTIRAACLGCDWQALCDGIAGGAYAGALVFPET
ncbi:DUF1284 domain-containing protein [Allorhizobium sp. BGMRC 0089]|uniref:DUF1284 domain-containing protein n=1 Tax=Allorhizobium sonneratiae TaxID=2934936 RepID=UPI0020349DCA|nr:DUF1284 domain-containing protein [Allorhizobium sonneratiae]MCM2294469.1 DUF1284 domain-containing protein [Allorhizobium sonneratiae]